MTEIVSNISAEDMAAVDRVVDSLMNTIRTRRKWVRFPRSYGYEVIYALGVFLAQHENRRPE